MRDIKIIIKEDSNLNTYNIETIPNKVLKGNYWIEYLSISKNNLDDNVIELIEYYINSNLNEYSFKHNNKNYYFKLTNGGK